MNNMQLCILYIFSGTYLNKHSKNLIREFMVSEYTYM